VSKKRVSSQGHIIDELHKIREALWKEHKGDMDRLSASATKRTKSYGLKITEPKIKAKSLEELRTRRKPAA
jgi:CRISPR/Cas system type I-B associated protein Csh2 (Cas7 group RAMP superfamily)